ncbi:MAG: single-stranded-DNA-specific exonuclease RecJ [Oscillospiraceae bacterium]|nr:single-stranded-DNA-specific exonuclease RecJ [Oscillospiraceae bacterium]
MEWKIPCVAGDQSNALEKLGFTPLLAAVLRARGADTPEKVSKYLSKDESSLCDPMLLTDMDKAVARIELAIDKHEKLAVYGDYDVDGITSACLLLDYFQSRGLDCEVYIPDRLDEGYGVNNKAVAALHENGVDLIITVDCGITAAEEVEYAKSLGMDMIITDHHECPQALPEASAVIDPKRQDSKYPFGELAGVGVAFKLICALEKDYIAPLERYADVVAVGTIADVMPLVGENRYLVYKGLEKLKNAPLPGFAALLEESGAAKKPITAATVGFSLAPRINAAGRLCQTETSIKLLLSKKSEDALIWAKELCALNRRRQELELEVWEEAMATLSGEEQKSPIVLESSSWHPGVVGIAASRLSEEYRLPTIMICLEEESGKGSCRSFGDFNIFEALSACSEHLESFGGHAFAAGLNIKPGNVDSFRKALAEFYRLNPPEEHPAIEPEIFINNPSVLSLEGVSSLNELEPCGSGNEHPLMCIYNAVLENVTPIGNGKHLKMRITHKGTFFDCVFFSRTAESLGVFEGDRVDVCFTPQINDFNSRKSVQLLITDVRRSETLEKCRDIIEKNQYCIEEVRNFRPERDDVATFWRKIKSLGGRLELSFDMFSEDFNLGFFEPIKLCLCIRILSELKLIDTKIGNGQIACAANETAEKTELWQSPLFRLLWENSRAEA